MVSEHAAHTQRWPHGMKACVPGMSMHTTHSALSSSAAAAASSAAFCPASEVLRRNLCHATPSQLAAERTNKRTHSATSLATNDCEPAHLQQLHDFRMTKFASNVHRSFTILRRTNVPTRLGARV